MTKPSDVIVGLSYFGIETLKAWSKNRERADWIDAFFSNELADVVTRFEKGIVDASMLHDTKCWVVGWGFFHQLRKDLRGLSNEFESVRRARDQKEYVEQLRKRLA